MILTNSRERTKLKSQHVKSPKEKPAVNAGRNARLIMAAKDVANHD